MPFLGVAHANARQILASYVPCLPPNVHVLCSGNFSLETTLRMNGFEGRLTGCDISLYTCSIGGYLAGTEIPLRLNTGDFPELAALDAYLGDQEGRAAAVAVALDALEWQEKQNHYAVRNYAAYCRRLGELVEKTRSRLQKKRKLVSIDSFFPMDGWDRIAMIPGDVQHAIIAFPPTYSRGYDRLFAKLDRLFRWCAPDYRELTTGTEFARKVVNSGAHWIIGTEKPTPELEVVVGRPIAVAPRGSSVSISLYSNMQGLQPQVFRRRVRCRESRLRRFTRQDQIAVTSKLSIHRIEKAEANYIRQLYCSTDVEQASAQFSYAVAIDKKLIGLLLFQDYSNAACNIDGSNGADLIYMMADLAVPAEQYPRLSKLVLGAAISLEMRDELQRRTIREIAFNVTTAFSRHPVSMKYRGAFRLLTRIRMQNRAYKLNYVARMGQKTLQETFLQWVKNQSVSTNSSQSMIDLKSSVG